MSYRELTQTEIRSLLVEERLVRVAFANASELYVITLGYAYHRDALYGVTSEGRKARLASEQPRVAFQVDTSITTGPFGWSSVTGEGTFQLVADRSETKAALAALESHFADAPDWWQRKQASRAAAGELRIWRIEPLSLAGREDLKA